MANFSISSDFEKLFTTNEKVKNNPDESVDDFENYVKNAKGNFSRNNFVKKSCSSPISPPRDKNKWWDYAKV